MPTKSENIKKNFNFKQPISCATFLFKKKPIELRPYHATCFLCLFKLKKKNKIFMINTV